MTMKFLSQVLFSIGLIGFALTGCEQHEFEKTKGLHLGHGEGHGEHGEAHGDAGHAKADDHAKADKDHAVEAPAAPAPAATETPRATGL
jgi:hypothetical protein